MGLKVDIWFCLMICLYLFVGSFVLLGVSFLLLGRVFGDFNLFRLLIYLTLIFNQIYNIICKVNFRIQSLMLKVRAINVILILLDN